jgi:glutamyl-Q tRNA(Asp) synthetase
VSVSTAGSQPSAGSPPAPYRGRFAPSPTGPLHFGSLVAAVASHADARAAGGQWLLRIEDVDEPRSRPGAESLILAALDRYGFEWDGPVTRQSERTALYEAALARLVADGYAYACRCTRRDLESAPVGGAGEHIYPGTCRDDPAASRARRQLAWRVRVGAAIVACEDRLQPSQRQNLARDVGDFVVKRADGFFAYQLAVVVDDAAQAITHVVRGADLLASTPRQVLLQKLLELPTLLYLHVPVAINAAGEKLSKQTRARTLPDTPLPALAAAWRFLDQPPRPEPPASVAEFWSWASVAWRATRLPPVTMLPAPAALEA